MFRDTLPESWSRRVLLLPDDSFTRYVCLFTSCCSVTFHSWNWWGFCSFYKYEKKSNYPVFLLLVITSFSLLNKLPKWLVYDLRLNNPYTQPSLSSHFSWVVESRGVRACDYYNVQGRYVVAYHTEVVTPKFLSFYFILVSRAFELSMRCTPCEKFVYLLPRLNILG